MSADHPANRFMQMALEEARAAAARGEVPVGAVIVSSAGEVLARAGNRTLEDRDRLGRLEETKGVADGSMESGGQRGLSNTRGTKRKESRQLPPRQIQTMREHHG